MFKAVRRYLFAVDHGGSAREHRVENLSHAEANRLAARSLLADERAYLNGELAKATTPEARQHFEHLLAEVNEMELRTHG